MEAINWNISLPSTSTGIMQKQGCVPKADKRTTTVVKVDKNDIRAKIHYEKTKSIDGKKYRVFECGLCGKEFKYQYTLTRHIPTHTDVRNFHCHVCGKSFRQMSTLAQHRATHWDIRPFKCEICVKSFNRVSTLISHKKIHTEQKKHICNHCGKGFHQKGNLKNHMYTHTNERPYKCDMCDKGFNQKSNLVVHKNSTHIKKVQNSLPQPSKLTLANQSNIRNNPKMPIIKKETNENIKPSQQKNSEEEEPILFIKKKPSPEMLECFAKNKIPFALYYKFGKNIPVLLKAVMDGDNFALMSPTYQDILEHKSYSSSSCSSKTLFEGIKSLSNDGLIMLITLQNLSPIPAPEPYQLYTNQLLYFLSPLLISVGSVINEHIENGEIDYIITSNNSSEQYSRPRVTEIAGISLRDTPATNDSWQANAVTHQINSGPYVKKEEIIEKKNSPDLANIKTEQHHEDESNVLVRDHDPVFSYHDMSPYSDLVMDAAKLEEDLFSDDINFMDYLADSLS